MAWRSACAMALAVSAGVCSAGRIGTVATGFGLIPVTAAVPDVCACAEAAAATIIKVAAITDLMTIPVLTRAQLSTSAWSAPTARGFTELHADLRRTRTLCPPHRAARSGRPRPGGAEGRVRAGGRRRRARRAGADVSGRGRHRHAGRGRRRHGVAVQPAAPDHPLYA